MSNLELFARLAGEAEMAQSATASKLLDAEVAQAEVTDRIFALTERRDAIVQRRAAGQKAAEDGADLALIAADLEGLGSILTEAEAAVAQAHTADVAASAALGSAKLFLERQQTENAEAALIGHANALAAKLTDTIGELGRIGQRLGRSLPVWSDRNLSKTLQNLCIRRREA